MKRISKSLRIIMTVILAITLIPVSPVKAGNDPITVNENSSIVITNMSDGEVEITRDMFDLSSTGWICVHDSSNITEFLYVDESFQKISLRNAGDKLICSPDEGEAFFYSSLLGDNVEVVLDSNKSSIGYCEIRCFDEWTITNNEAVDISLFWIGEYDVEYTYIRRDGMVYTTTTEGEFPDIIEAGATLIFTVVDDASFSITNPYAGVLWYTTGKSNQIKVSKTVAEKYSTTDTYEMDGCIYTVTNSSDNLNLEFYFNATTQIQAEIYDSKGVLTGTVNNAQNVGKENATSIPAGGKIVFSGVEAPNETLSIKYSSLYDSVIDVSGVRKAKPAENKKIYIHYADGSLVPEGLSKDSKGYYVSAEVTYVDTTMDQEKDTVGGFSILPIKDTTGRAVVNKWYVYNSETGTYYDASVVTGNTFTVEPLTTGIYSQLLDTYGNSSEYHLYVEWDRLGITQSGTYNLMKDVQYTFGSGSWTVADDVSVYSGNMNFYVDGAAGNYQLTLQ